ncbi:SRPBCC domain-containing protein [Streptomyces hilarionis]|uniref:SRPBCC domain-containing protein n=1 Tax=Streptomyces hilarionis TaxID=2839954 RepID=UPI002119D966|nr:SRPBCC domain-containing protein [Streptomyces hilarionis]MCQ9134743.1 SRPBCC family protein [Streptomyces hilarionis]
MEHEVFVPVPAERLTAALADPAQVARAVPGLQQDAGTEPVAGRLKVRIGGHTITYRGAVRVSPREDGGYAVEGDATEARGGGSVKLALTLRLRDADGGATLRFEGTATADGRVTELPSEAVDSAVARLLNRFAGNLGARSAEDTPKTGPAPAPAPQAGPSGKPPGEAETDGGTEGRGTDQAAAAAEAAAGADDAKTRQARDAAAAPDGVDGGDPGDAGDLDDVDEPAVHENVEDAEDVEELEDVFEAEAPLSGLDGLTGPEEPAAEAAHARRTMIGRSAEEVDHAPPRGRYAPVPAPQTVVPNSTLRWAAPAAALVVASAIVVGRALRRRT